MRREALWVIGLWGLTACGSAPTPTASAGPPAQIAAPPPHAAAKPSATPAPTPDAAHALALAGDFKAAAAMWEAIAIAHPHATATAEFNALMLSRRTEADRDVQARAARFIATHPDGPMRRAAANVHAEASELLFDFEAAIASYLDVAARSPQPREAAGPLMRASALSSALGQHLRAAGLAERAITADPILTPSLLAVAESYAQSGSAAHGARVAALERLAAADDHRWASLTAQVQLAQMRKGEARAAAFKALAARTRGDADPRLDRIRALALFEQAEPAFQRFAASRWPKTSAAQVKHLQRLLQEGAELRQAYTDLIKHNDVEWALAGLWRTGRVFEVFDTQLRAIPAPPGLAASAAKAWRADIDARRHAFRSQAIEAWQAVVTKATHLGISNRWTLAARAALCASDLCPPPAPPTPQVTIAPATPPFAPSADPNAVDRAIFTDLLTRTDAAQRAAIARFEAAPGVRFARLNRLRAALQIAPRLAHVVGDWPWVRADPWALDMLAESLMSLDAPGLARELLTEAARLPDPPAEVYARVAVIEASTGRWATALAHLEQALRRRPNFIEAMRLRDQITNRMPVAK